MPLNCIPTAIPRQFLCCTQWGIHVTKGLEAQSLLLFLAPLQVGLFLEYLDLYLMEFFQIKRRLRRRSSSFWWCQCYSAIWSDSLEHFETVFRQNSCTLSRWPRLTAKTFFECFQELGQIAEWCLHHLKQLDFLRTLHFIWTNSIWYE